MNELEELQKFLEKAHGEITIKVDGLVPHVEGTINDSGMMMAAFACMKCIETRRGESFDDTVEMMKGLNSIMGYHVEGKINGEEYDWSWKSKRQFWYNLKEYSK